MSDNSWLSTKVAAKAPTHRVLPGSLGGWEEQDFHGLWQAHQPETWDRVLPPFSPPRSIQIRKVNKPSSDNSYFVNTTRVGGGI